MTTCTVDTDRGDRDAHDRHSDRRRFGGGHYGGETAEVYSRIMG